MTRRGPVVYIEASLLADDDLEPLLILAELGIRAAVVVEDRARPSSWPPSVEIVDVLPPDLRHAWYLTDRQPDSTSDHWSRTIVVGPRAEPGRRTHVGIRTARDVRVALLEIAAEGAAD